MEINMEITTSTVYTKERLLKFSRFHFFSNTKRIVFYSVLTVILFVVALFSVIYGLITKSFNSFSYYFILLFAFTVLLDAFNLFMALILPLFTVKKAKSLNATVEFIFKDDGFIMKSHSDFANGEEEYSYSAFERVANKNGELYLYLSRNTCYIADVSSLLAEEREQLKAVLSKNIKKVKWK